MGKVLFYYDNYCGENSHGGTEVATFRIARALKDCGREVYNAFRNGKKVEYSGLYNDVIRLDKAPVSFVNQLAAFINDRQIDVIVNMSRFFRHPLLVKAIKKSCRDVRLVFMQHFAPGSEWKKGTFHSGFHLFRMDPLNPLYWLRATLYPLLKLPRKINYPKAYGRVYEDSDRVVLLSRNYIADYKRISGVKDASRFVAIPNIFESKETAKSFGEIFQSKEKRVLILSRMDEIQKRLSLALKIWRIIENIPDLKDWHLDIVGTGHDLSAVRKLSRRLKLKNVTFHGWQRGEPFLKKASVLMLTSEYEGLPLSILEAQTFGCVPIAFDSFGSLRDVVSDGDTGIVVDKFGDIEGYAKRLEDLMRNEEMRRSISEKGIAATSKFSSEIVGKQWEGMLKKIMSDN